MLIPMAAAGLKSNGAGTFDPESVGWHSLFWAEGTDFVAAGYSDTDAVGTWPNETGESDATQGNGAAQPTYDAAHASFNNKPVVDFDGTGDFLSTGAFSVNPSYTSGVSLVIIARHNVGSVTADDVLIDGIGASNRHLIRLENSSPDAWSIFAGTSVLEGGTPDTNAHLFVAKFDGSTGADTLDVDGANVINANAGSHTLTGLTFGNSYTSSAFWPGQFAFVGLWAGDVTAESWWADFVSDIAETHYGLTVA